MPGSGIAGIVAASPAPPSYDQLLLQYDDTKTSLSELYAELAALGNSVKDVDAADDLEVLSQLDSASLRIDPTVTAYENYLARLGNLNRAAGRFLADQWYISQADYDLIQDVNALPFKVGALRASMEAMDELAASLDALGEGAGVAVDTANKVVTFAETSHKVLTAVEMVGGVSVIVKTGATLLVKEGIKACAKQAAKELVKEVVTSVAAGIVSGYVVNLLGLTPQQAQLVRLGVNSFQVFSFLKAAKTKVDWDGACFVAGTNVVTGLFEDGTFATKRIEDVKVGDLVLARDQHDAGDDLDPRRVTNVFRKTSDHVRTLAVAGDGGNVERVETTDEHPFWVRGQGWINAAALAVGDALQEPDGSWQTVLSTAYEAVPGGVTVYNFEVEGDHTYFVADADVISGTDPLWVHNACVGGKFVARLDRGTRRGIEVPFGVTASNQTFRLRHQSEMAALRAGERQSKETFVKSVANQPSLATQLQAAGVPQHQIWRMENLGLVPTGYQVHHKRPLQWGGDNTQSNFILMRNPTYHEALTDEQRLISNQLTTLGLAEDGTGEFEVSWPVFTDKIYIGE